MKKVTQTDLRTIRTKNAIHAAFQQMATEIGIEHITVKELAQLAGINRKTFYSHYDSIEDLAQELLQNLLQEIRQIIHNEAPHDFRDTLGDIYRFLCSLPVWYRNLMCSKDNPHGQKIFMELMGVHLLQYQIPMSESQQKQYMKLRYIAAASLEMFKLWHELDGAMPVEEFIDAATGLVCFGERYI